MEHARRTSDPDSTPPEPGPATPGDEAGGSLLSGIRAQVDASASDDGDGRRRRALVERADGAGLLDIAYRTVDTPIGVLLVAATTEGVVRLAFESEDHTAVLDGLAHTVSPRILRSGRRTDDAARQLEEYFTGQRRTFDLALDLRLVGGFRRHVLAHLLEIPYGRTASYAAVARAAGNPQAVRAAGSACARNPVPVVVPCHRVVRSDGTIGQYLGGPDTKRALLALEQAA